MIQNFGVAQNSGDFKATNHPYKITFLLSTHLREVDDSLIDVNGFLFTPFDKIVSKDHDHTCLIGNITLFLIWYRIVWYNVLLFIYIFNKSLSSILDVIAELTGIGELENTTNFDKNNKRVAVELSDNK